MEMKKTIAILIILNLVLTTTIVLKQRQITINILQNKLSISESVNKHIFCMLFLSNMQHYKKEMPKPNIVKENVVVKKPITVKKKSTKKVANKVANNGLCKITFYTLRNF